jgi:hypothetical protein
VNVRTKLATAQLAQERAYVLAYTSTVQSRASTEALAVQAPLMVSGQVLANALATSCGLTASKPLIARS